MSFLEREALVNLFLFAIKHKLDCTFQYPIKGFDDGCALEEWCFKNDKDFKCREGFDGYEGCVDETCKYNYNNQYNKYFLDFAMIKEKVKVAIELDGWQFHKNKKKQDDNRDRYLEQEGWIVKRHPYSTVIKNKERIFDDLIEIFKGV